MMELKNFSTRYCPKGTYFLHHVGHYDKDCSLYALKLYDENNFPQLVVTVFVEGVDVPGGHILIKSWSENKGLFEALLAARVVESVATLVPTGHVKAHLCKLTDHAIRELGL